MRWLLALVCCLAGCAAAEVRLEIDVDRVDLAELAQDIARQARRNVVVSPYLEETVSVRLRDIPWRDALEVVARMTRCEVREWPEGVLLVDQRYRVSVNHVTISDLFTTLDLLGMFAGVNV
ncbi:MAG: hypothetical protein IIC29_04615, partial [Chloroflexi bacterium]|nr:hypothetical protein [Chloroflexota bacterium]